MDTETRWSNKMESKADSGTAYEIKEVNKVLECEKQRCERFCDCDNSAIMEYVFCPESWRSGEKSIYLCAEHGTDDNAWTTFENVELCQ